jgi:hypothetical protein
MIVGSAQPMAEPPQASFELGRFTVTVFYRVITNDRADGPKTVCFAPGLPALFDAYRWGNDYDEYMLCREYDPQLLVDAATRTWKIGVKYSTPERKGGSDSTGGGTGKETAGEYANPLLELPTAKFAATDKESLMQQVYDPITGSVQPATASNGQVFDPPPKTLDGFGILTITRNEPITANHPYLAWLYMRKVNLDYFWGLPPGSWKFKEISPESQNRQLPNGSTVSFLRVSYRAEFNPDGWDTSILDYGDYSLALDPRGPNYPLRKVPFMTANNQPTAMPLNGRGAALQDKLPFTALPGANVIVLPASTPPIVYKNGDRVQVNNIGGELPIPLKPNSTYFVINPQPAVPSGQEFSLAASTPNVTISGVRNAAGLGVIVTTNQPHNLVDGQTVVILDAQAVNVDDEDYFVNDAWQIGVISPTSFSLKNNGVGFLGDGDPDEQYASGGLIAVPITILSNGTGTSYIWAPAVYIRIRPFQRLPFAFLQLPNSFAQCQ